jgi:hypothetical protein
MMDLRPEAGSLPKMISSWPRLPIASNTPNAVLLSR